jgi:hypothetical protein
MIAAALLALGLYFALRPGTQPGQDPQQDAAGLALERLRQTPSQPGSAQYQASISGELAPRLVTLQEPDRYLSEVREDDRLVSVSGGEGAMRWSFAPTGNRLAIGDATGEATLVPGDLLNGPELVDHRLRGRRVASRGVASIDGHLCWLIEAVAPDSADVIELAVDQELGLVRRYKETKGAKTVEMTLLGMQPTLPASKFAAASYVTPETQLDLRWKGIAYSGVSVGIFSQVIALSGDGTTAWNALGQLSESELDRLLSKVVEQLRRIDSKDLADALGVSTSRSGRYLAPGPDLPRGLLEPIPSESLRGVTGLRGILDVVSRKSGVEIVVPPGADSGLPMMFDASETLHAYEILNLLASLGGHSVRIDQGKVVFEKR